MIQLLFVSKKNTDYIYVPDGVKEIFLLNEEWFYPSDCLKAAVSLDCNKGIDLQSILRGGQFYYDSGLYTYCNDSYIGYFNDIDSSSIMFIGWQEEDSPPELKPIWEKIKAGEFFMED
jgi:hypothetical protein